MGATQAKVGTGVAFRGLDLVLGATGLAAVILAARGQAWQLGHWSQDLSPVPLLVGIALLSIALAPPGSEASLGREHDGHLLPYLGAGLAAAGLALLGHSGLGLLLSGLLTLALLVYMGRAGRRSRSARAALK